MLSLIAGTAVLLVLFSKLKAVRER